MLLLLLSLLNHYPAVRVRAAARPSRGLCLTLLLLIHFVMCTLLLGRRHLPLASHIRPRWRCNVGYLSSEHSSIDLVADTRSQFHLVVSVFVLCYGFHSRILLIRNDCMPQFFPRGSGLCVLHFRFEADCAVVRTVGVGGGGGGGLLVARVVRHGLGVGRFFEWCFPIGRTFLLYVGSCCCCCATLQFWRAVLKGPPWSRARTWHRLEATRTR